MSHGGAGRVRLRDRLLPRGRRLRRPHLWLGLILPRTGLWRLRSPDLRRIRLRRTRWLLLRHLRHLLPRHRCSGRARLHPAVDRGRRPVLLRRSRRFVIRLRRRHPLLGLEGNIERTARRRCLRLGPRRSRCIRILRLRNRAWLDLGVDPPQ